MLLHWIWFSQLPGVSDRGRMALLERFGDPEALLNAGERDLPPRLPEETQKALARKDLDEAGKILEQCSKKGLSLLTFRDGAYPARLKNIPDPPMVLYYRGTLPDWDAAPTVAIVGTRSASLYGLGTAKRMGYQVASQGGIVVSGMAQGVDGMAAEGALTAGGVVVGVLGTGADRVYPRQNRALFQEVAERGCLLSEFPPGSPPERWHFPRRNRVLSGLCHGVLVVEAPVKSGALITARLAADQGRDVFVVPGNVDVESCAGSNALLREGAIAVTCGEDVISEYKAQFPHLRRNGPASLISEAPAALRVAQEPQLPKKSLNTQEKNDKKSIDKEVSPPYSETAPSRPPLTDTEAKVLALVQGEMPVDELIAAAGLPAGTVQAALITLEIKKRVRRLPGPRVAPC